MPNFMRELSTKSEWLPDEKSLSFNIHSVIRRLQFITRKEAKISDGRFIFTKRRTIRHARKWFRRHPKDWWSPAESNERKHGPWGPSTKHGRVVLALVLIE